jgi:hypothetical protein
MIFAPDHLPRVPSNAQELRLAEILRGVYEEVFEYVDPSKDDLTAIRDAFRGYTPHGQQELMVSLFLGLCQKAGLSSSEAPQCATRPVKKSLPSARAQKIGTTTIKQQLAGAGNSPAPLSELLATLPSPGNGWTQENRDRFHRTFGALLDYCFPICEDTYKDRTDSLQPATTAMATPANR